MYVFANCCILRERLPAPPAPSDESAGKPVTLVEDDAARFQTPNPFAEDAPADVERPKVRIRLFRDVQGCLISGDRLALRGRFRWLLECSGRVIGIPPFELIT